MILAFAHPALVVPDLERAREFYEAMFGFRRFQLFPVHLLVSVDWK